MTAPDPLSVWRSFFDSRAPVPLTIYATSLDDSYQTARIDLVVTN